MLYANKRHQRHKYSIHFQTRVVTLYKNIKPHPSYLGHNNSKVASRSLDSLPSHLGKVSDLLLRKTDLDLAVKNGNRRWDGAIIPHDLLDSDSGFKVGRVRHAMGDDGALEGDKGLLLLQGGFYFVREAEGGR